MTQKNKQSYDFANYCYPERWASYYNQIREIFNLNVQTILNVGTGDGFLKRYLKNNQNIVYKDFDIDEKLNPDVVGDILKMPFTDNAFEAVCVFEVLEHLPFEDFENALKEINRISARYALLSLPHFGPAIKFLIKFPLIPEIHLAFKAPFPIKHIFNGEHYWEIGKRGFPSRKIRKIIKKYFFIEKEFIPFESQYHHFYILKKKI